MVVKGSSANPHFPAYRADRSPVKRHCIYKIKKSFTNHLPSFLCAVIRLLGYVRFHQIISLPLSDRLSQIKMGKVIPSTIEFISLPSSLILFYPSILNA